MSDTIVMPPRIHWPEPENSGWLNCAMLPLPLITASSMLRVASTLTLWRCAMSLMSCWPAGESCRMGNLQVGVTAEKASAQPLPNFINRSQIAFGEKS